MPSVVDVAPALGQAVVPLQAGPGASPGYGAIDHRRAWTNGLQEGAIDFGSYVVTQDSGGPSLDLEVAGSSGTGCYVQGDDVAAQGLYYVAPDAGTITLTLDPADVSNPRLDQVILEVEDDTHDSSALNKARVRILKGTPTSGATLDNRSGNAALPNGAMRLADVLVAAGDSTITNVDIRDRRKLARGVAVGFVAPIDTTHASATPVAINGMATTRVELSGAPLDITFSGSFVTATANGQVTVGIYADGALQVNHTQALPTVTQPHGVSFSLRSTALSGSKLIEVRFSSDFAFSLTAKGGAVGNPCRASLREHIAA